MTERASQTRRDLQAGHRDRACEADADPIRRVRVPIRTKLVVGRADDPAERAADEMAAIVVSRLGESRVAGPGRLPTGRVMRSAVSLPSGAAGEVDGGLDGDIRRATRSSAPGSDDVLRRMGDAFGTDFGDVRLHTGGGVDRAADQLQARAFAIGNDVYVRRSDYRPGTDAGDEVLAHELAHTMQDRGGVRRKIVRRLLIPKALDAFNAAEAANPAFADGRTNTDQFAAKADQEDLTRVHGRMHTGTDSDDQRKVAHFVRAVVLDEYAQRLSNLQTATDDTGAPLSDRAKAGKRKVYKSKAEEFRQKYVPLVAKGSTAPDTQSFLREYGFDAAFGDLRAQAAKKGPTTPRIEVRATFIGGPILGIRLRSHLYIVYTGGDGRQMYFRGGPDEDDFTVAAYGDYVPGTIDWDPSAPSVTLAEGAAAESKLDALIEATGVIDGMKVPYRAVISKSYGGAKPNAAQQALNYAAMGVSGEGENCNATAWTILTRAGLRPKKPSGKHPGWGSILGSKTTGKEHALPAAEVMGAGTEYELDDSHEVTDAAGMVQVYRDRTFHSRLYKVAAGTKVLLLDDLAGGVRRISFNGTVGYVARWDDDVLYDLFPGWIADLRNTFSDDDIDRIIAENDDRELVRQASHLSGVPTKHIVEAATMARSGDGGVTAMVRKRLDLLGRARIREMLTNPAEIQKLAASMGADPVDVTDIATSMIGKIEFPDRVAASLQTHLNDPNAANLALNEAPDYPTVVAIAAELGADFGKVLGAVERQRPPANQGHHLVQLLADDPIAESELPDVADFMLKSWAAATGVPVGYLKARCVLIHQANVAAKAKQEADDKARAEADAATKQARGRQQAKRPAKPKRAPKPIAEKPKADVKQKPRDDIEQSVVNSVYLQVAMRGYGEDKPLSAMTDDEVAEIAKIFEFDGVTADDVKVIAKYYLG